ncbi:MAG: hypothetical protein R2864_03620 [Syntrophotaleaceae bacterium]
MLQTIGQRDAEVASEGVEDNVKVVELALATAVAEDQVELFGLGGLSRRVDHALNSNIAGPYRGKQFGNFIFGKNAFHSGLYWTTNSVK